MAWFKRKRSQPVETGYRSADILRQAAYEICREAEERRRAPWRRFVERMRGRAGFQILATVGVLLAGASFFFGYLDARRSKHLQCWQTLNSAVGKPGDAGRRLALETLNGDGVDLSGIDLQGADLYRINLRGASLGGARLDSANLGQANLRETWLAVADLSATDLREAILTEAKLRAASLAGAELAATNLSGANLKWSDLTGILWRHSAVYTADGQLLIYSNFEDANLRGITMSSPDSADFIDWAREHGAICDPPPEAEPDSTK